MLLTLRSLFRGSAAARPLRSRSAVTRLASGVCAAGLLACRGGGFQLEKIGSDSTALFTAGVTELGVRHWGNAILVFEKLTTDLPARDTLLPRAQYLLGHARTGNREFLLAAQAYSKVAENYPEDTLADDALFESARSYQKLWRSPELDSQYGTTAEATFRTLVDVYPDSPRRKDAEQQLLVLRDMFATKEYITGYYYYRRKAYDPAIVYFKTVIARYPDSPKVRDAYLRMVESYRVIQYKEEAAESCAAVRAKFAADPEVQKLCPPVAAARDSAATKPTPGMPAARLP